MRPRFTGRGSALLGGGGALTVGGMVLGVPDLVRWGAAGLAIVLLSAALVTMPRPRVDVEITRLSLPLTAGAPAALVMGVRPRAWTPPGDVRLVLPPGLGGERTWATIPLRLPFHQRASTITLNVTVRPHHRGLHVLPPVVVRAEDPFGLATSGAVVGTPTPVLVLPRLHPLGDLRPVETLDPSGSVPARPRPDPEAADMTVRPYVPGDDLRRVHWTLSAHRGDLMIRQEEPTGSSTLLLVLDPHLARPQQPVILEWAVEFLASATVALAEAGIPVSLLAPAPSPRTPAAEALGHLPPGPAVGVRESLRLLAVTPSRPSGFTGSSDVRGNPDHPHVPDPERSWGAEIRAARQVVLLTGDRDLGLTRALLSSLPPGGRGTAVVVAAHRGPLPVVGPARDGGWEVTVAQPTTPPADVWAEALGEGLTAGARGWGR